MNANLILLFIATVFLPGIVWAKIRLSKSTGPKPQFGYFIADSFVFGFLAYMLLIPLLVFFQVILCIMNLADVFTIIRMIGNFLVPQSFNFPYTDLVILSFICTIFTPLFAMLWSHIPKSKLTAKITTLFPKSDSKLRNTGGLDVWTYSLDQDIDSNYYVRIVDYKSKRVYEGSVVYYSGNEVTATKEILMGNVLIFRQKESIGDDSELDVVFESQLDYVYLSLSTEHICMEYIRPKNFAGEKIETTE